jgi:hypothetical protein
MADVTALSPAELIAAGVQLVGYRTVRTASKTHAAWRSHSEMLRDNPTRDAVQRSQARAVAARHVAEHGSLEGLRLPRSFPCLGTFRVIEDDGKRPATVECDGCGETLGVTQKALIVEEGATW